mgnify:FL=1
MKPGLSPTERLDWTLYAKDAHAFVFGLEEPVLWTKDEHDQERPEKPFPDYDYLRCILDCLLVSGRFLRPLEASYALAWGIPLTHLERQASMGMVFMEKSRQVLASWVCCAYILWRAKFHPHQLCIVQSKKEDDAVKFVFIKEAQQARISFMESRLPLWLQDGLFIGHQETPLRNKREFVKRSDSGHLWFPNGSHIWAVPQGGDIIRSNTPSCLFSDEAAFQPAFALAYQACLPSLKGGGQGVFISSAEIGDFATLIEAEV